MNATMKAAELAATLNTGDCLDYETVNDLGDMATDELVDGLRRRKLRMNREDTDCIWIETSDAE